VAALPGFDVTDETEPDGKFTFENVTTPFSVTVEVEGTNLQSSGLVLGTTGGDSLVVFTRDGTPFTEFVTRAESASDTTLEFGGHVVDPGEPDSASVPSATHWSELVLDLDKDSGDKVVLGAAWALTVGTESDRTTLQLSGAPAENEVWTVRLTRRSSTSTYNHTATADDTLASIRSALALAVNGDTGTTGFVALTPAFVSALAESGPGADEATVTITSQDARSFTTEGGLTGTYGIDSTPDTTTVVTLSGTPAADEIWSVSLTADGITTTYQYEVQAGDTVVQVAEGLAEAINDHNAATTMTVAHLGVFEVGLEITPAGAEASAVEVLTSETLSSVGYDYVTGSNREVLVPDSMDVTIADDDAPGVLILQSADSTDVIEPTESVLLGSGFLSQQGTVRFKLEGTPVVGEIWTVVLTIENPVQGDPDFTVSRDYMVGGGDDLAVIAASLAAELELLPQFSAMSSGAYLTVEHVDGVPFSMYLKQGTGGVIFIGDFGMSVTREIGIHDSVFIAQDIDTAKWNTNANTNIKDSTDTPHLTIIGTGDGHADF
jgi:predicted RecA/RadA family phage recombinase